MATTTTYGGERSAIKKVYWMLALLAAAIIAVGFMAMRRNADTYPASSTTTESTSEDASMNMGTGATGTETGTGTGTNAVSPGQNPDDTVNPQNNEEPMAPNSAAPGTATPAQ